MVDFRGQRTAAGTRISRASSRRHELYGQRDEPPTVAFVSIAASDGERLGTLCLIRKKAPFTSR